MEYLIASSIKAEIELIDRFIGGNQILDVYVSLTDGTKRRISFDYVCDFRYCVENACIDRFTKFNRKSEESCSVFIVVHSDYVRYFEQQASGTRPVDNLKEYILVDRIDTVISVLSESDPILSPI